jgi:hypothetical protein
MKRKKILKALEISFGICLILAGIFFVVFKSVKINSSLIEFMPANAGIFIEYNLNNKDLKELQANNFRAKSRLEAMFSQMKFFGDLTKYLTDNVERVAILTLLDEEESWEKIWIVRAKNIHQINALLPADYYYSNLDSTTIAISKNHELLQTLRSNKISLNNKFKAGNFLNLYASAGYLNYLKQKNQPEFFLILNNINLDFEKEIYLGLKANKDKVDFNFNGSKNENRKITNFSKNNSEILKFLNNRSSWLKIASANLENLYSNFIKNYLNLEGNNPPKVDKKEIEEKYEFKFQEIEEILNSNASVLLIENTENPLVLEDFENINKQNWTIIVENNLSENKIDLIKKIAKNIVAFKYPRIVQEVLADKTKSNQIIADADYFTFDKTELGIEYLFYKDFKFAIYATENYLFLGNNIKQIENVLAEETKWLQLGNVEPTKDFDFEKKYEAVVIDSKRFTFGALRFFDKMIFGIEESMSEIKIEGEILW